jgi:Bifunctional DNA primase/polymerase, N-terminal
MNNYFHYKHANSGYPVHFELVNIYDKLLEHERAVLLPIKPGEKRPAVGRGWDKTKYEDTQTPEYRAQLEYAFNNAAVGVLPGNGIYAIDVDSDELANEFLSANPRLQNTLRTRGARGCQFWIKIDADCPANSPIKLNGKAIGEWRSKGNQSIIYGQHPEGPRYQILTQEKPVTIKFSEINWPEGWKTNFNEPPRKNASGTNGTKDKSADLHKRIVAYIARCPGAVSHQGGHSQTLCVASSLTLGYELSAGEAMPYMEIYNGKCEPPWSPKELEHKIDESIAKPPTKHPRGYLLNDEPEVDEFDGKSEYEVKEHFDEVYLRTPSGDFPWPARKEAFHGIAGKIVKIATDNSELRPEAVLAQFLTAFGNMLGRGLYKYQESRHGTNINVEIIGTTADGAKGGSWRTVKNLMMSVGPKYSERISGGDQSGESIIEDICDEVQGTNDEGETINELHESLKRVHEIALGVFEGEAFLGALEKGLDIVKEMGATIKGFAVSSLEVRGKREVLQNQAHSMLESMGRGGQFGKLTRSCETSKAERRV